MATLTLAVIDICPTYLVGLLFTANTHKVAI